MKHFAIYFFLCSLFNFYATYTMDNYRNIVNYWPRFSNQRSYMKTATTVTKHACVVAAPTCFFGAGLMYGEGHHKEALIFGAAGVSSLIVLAGVTALSNKFSNLITNLRSDNNPTVDTR